MEQEQEPEHDMIIPDQDTEYSDDDVSVLEQKPEPEPDVINPGQKGDDAGY